MHLKVSWLVPSHSFSIHLWASLLVPSHCFPVHIGINFLIFWHSYMVNCWVFLHILFRSFLEHLVKTVRDDNWYRGKSQSRSDGGSEIVVTQHILVVILLATTGLKWRRGEKSEFSRPLRYVCTHGNGSMIDHEKNVVEITRSTKTYIQFIVTKTLGKSCPALPAHINYHK